MIDISISIGSNIPDRALHIEDAIGLMQVRIGDVIKRSSLYETSSWGFDSEPFLNAVVELHTDRSPMDCLEQLLRIEEEMGRVRKGDAYVDRVIDLDILSYGHRRFVTDGLTIPHPRFAERRFVLEPWAEICPDLKVAGSDMTVKMYKEDCEDEGQCVRLEYV